MLATVAALLVLGPALALAMDMVTILSKIPPDPLEPYDKWEWSELGVAGGKAGRVYNFPLSFGPPPAPAMMEQKTGQLLSLQEALDLELDSEEGGELDQDTRRLVLGLARAAKIVSAITRYPLARQRAGGQAARYEAAARTAFTDEVTAAGGGAGGGAGLVWVQGEAAPALLMDQATTAVSLAPLVCGHNIRAGGPLGSVFTLADMEWDGLRPRLAGYVLYSSVTVLLLNIGDTVREFTLDQDDVFRMTEANVSMPDNQQFYNINPDPEMLEVVRSLNLTAGEVEVKQRSGEDCLVADVHRILKKGGLLVDTDSSFSAQFLLSPLSMLVTRAGGLASNGTDPFLDLKPKYQNETLPILLGDKLSVETLVERNLPTYYP